MSTEETRPTVIVNSTDSWTFEEKQRFVKALSQGPPYKSKTGKINWVQLQKYVRTKSLEEVKEFAKKFHALEHGQTYPEFSKKAAVDVWREVAEKTTQPGDDIINVCIPQALTVAALEPRNNKGAVANVDEADLPDYTKIYNYMSAITGGREIPELSAADAAVVLDLLEDIILTLSKSETLVQREFMHTQYQQLRKYLELDTTQDSEQQSEQNRNDLKHYSSTNPFGIPFEMLDFKCFAKVDK